MNWHQLMAIPISPRGAQYTIGTSHGQSYFSLTPVVYGRPLPATCPGCGASAFAGRDCTFCGRTS